MAIMSSKATKTKGAQVMGKGGDSTTTTNTNKLADFAQPYYEGMISKGQTLSNQGYTPYQGQRLAEFSGDTNTAFDMIRKQAAAGTGGLDAAQAAAAKVQNYQEGKITSNNVGIGAAFDPRTVPEMDIGAYMNPYINNVMDVNTAAAERRYQEQQVMRDDGAIKAGAFGGDRRFVSDSMAQRDHNEQLDTMNATMLNAGYDRATALATGDERLRFDAFTGDANRAVAVNTGNADRSLQAGIANEEARRLAGSLRLDASGQSAQMAQQWQDMGLRNAEALSTVGAKTQQRTQAGLDIAYADFGNQQTDQRDKLSWYASLLAGAPLTPSNTQTTTEAAPDFLSQLIGLGTSAVGLGGMFS